MATHDADTATSSPTREQFWNLYLAEHQQLANCWLHVLGTVSSWLIMGFAVFWKQWWLLMLVPVVGYGLAWLGHWLIEGNRPVSVRYPLRSLTADYRLTWQMLAGGRRGATSADSAEATGSFNLESDGQETQS